MVSYVSNNIATDYYFHSFFENILLIRAAEVPYTLEA